MSTAIQIRGLTKTFAGPRGSVTAVDRADLDIAPGELFFLLGPSGCGKTTLLRMIAGFIDPSAGSIAFNGADVTRMAPNRRNTGMVFQSYALWPHMTVADNVAFGLKVRKLSRRDRRQRVDEALDAVQLAGYGKRKPNELSGGQQQRVALARALVIRPDVLLLDEPLSNLDAKLRNDLRDQIRDICKDSGLTSIYVTHDQKEALSMADRIAILDHGRVIQHGTPRDLYRHPGSRFVAAFLGETNFIDATIASIHESPAPHQPATAAHAHAHAVSHAEAPHAEAPDANGNGHAATLTQPSPMRDVLLECDAGHLRTRINGKPAGLAPGMRVTCSIRPEAFRFAGPDTHEALAATRRSTTYLGELAQHLFELRGGARIKVAELNPFGGGRHFAPDNAAGSTSPTDDDTPNHASAANANDAHTHEPDLALTVSPEDVVVLPPDPPNENEPAR